MILCCGEALIDMIPSADADGETRYAPRTGGAVFNTAIALARLGAEVGLVSGISRDPFGEMLVAALKADGVDTRWLIRSARLSTLAMAHLKDGSASYAFYDENSAGRMIDADDAPAPPSEVKALFFGGVSLVANPAADAYAKMLRQWRAGRIVMLDPNIRPGFITDRDGYRARLDRMIAETDYLKVSDEDLAWLTDGDDSEDAARRLLERGPSVVIVTQGARGAFAVTEKDRVSAPAVPVKVADTIGAGDTFNAGFLFELDRQGALRREPGESALTSALRLGAASAAYTCSRGGADPPRIDDLR